MQTAEWKCPRVLRQLHPCFRKMAEVKVRLQRHRTNIETKEANKTVSLGTSKVNYMDPRITVAWCKKVRGCFEFQLSFT